MSVKRYDYHKDTRYSSSFMDEHPHGLYVQWPDYEALAAENEGLRSALEAVANWACLLSDDALGNYERVADEFYRETRHMRPGKDDARHYHTDEERTARWNNWCEVKRMAITVRVREALSRKAAP